MNDAGSESRAESTASRRRFRRRELVQADGTALVLRADGTTSFARSTARSRSPGAPTIPSGACTPSARHPHPGAHERPAGPGHRLREARVLIAEVTPVKSLQAQLASWPRAPPPPHRLREPILAHGAAAVGPLAGLAADDPELGASVTAWLEVLASATRRPGRPSSPLADPRHDQSRGHPPLRHGGPWTPRRVGLRLALPPSTRRQGLTGRLALRPADRPPPRG